jgi:hypothetical protein
MNSDYQPTIDAENDCLNRPDMREVYSSNSESQRIFLFCYESGTWIFGYRLLEVGYSDWTAPAKKVLRSSARADHSFQQLTLKLVGPKSLGCPKGCPILARRAFAEVLTRADAILFSLLLIRFCEHSFNDTRHRVHTFFPPRLLFRHAVVASSKKDSQHSHADCFWDSTLNDGD